MPSLSQFTTFGLSASSHALYSFSDVMSFFSKFPKDDSVFLLGEGSNTIFIEDFEGTVLVNKIRGVYHKEDCSNHYLRVGAGENWQRLLEQCMRQQWFGMENLALIPGSVGAAPIQNIGAYGTEVKHFIDTVECVDLITGVSFTLSNEECMFGYRESVFKNRLANKVLITHVNFLLSKNYEPISHYGELSQLDNPAPLDIYKKVISIRESKLPNPRELGNAGSFFKNPVITLQKLNELKERNADIPFFTVSEADVKVPAAWLIDKAGFKGKSYNQIRCHPTQPLVLTNLGGATGEDLIAFARQIISRVNERFGITLEPEVRLVGRNGLITL